MIGIYDKLFRNKKKYWLFPLQFCQCSRRENGAPIGDQKNNKILESIE